MANLVRVSRIDESEGLLEDGDQDAVSLGKFASHLASLFPDERESLESVMDSGCSKPPSMIYI